MKREVIESVSSASDCTELLFADLSSLLTGIYSIKERGEKKIFKKFLKPLDIS